MELTTEFQKVLETSTKVTQNVTGYLRLYLKYGGRDEINNKDIIYYEIRQYAYNPYGNYLAWEWTGDLSWNIKLGTSTIASGTYKQTPAIYSDGNERLRISGSWEQEHNSDGTWSSTISFEGYVYQTKVNASGNIELPLLPRKTKIQATDAKINGISTFYLNRQGNSFNHKLYYKTSSNGAKNLIEENINKDSYQWTVPDDIYKVMSTKEIRLYIVCETYNINGISIGSDETSMIASAVDSDARPTFDVLIQNEGINGNTGILTGSTQAFIKGYTTAILDVSIGLKKWATLKEYRVQNGNKSSNAQDIGISEIPTKTFSFYVLDSRDYYPEEGYPLKRDVPIFIEYFSPQIFAPKIARIEQTSTQVLATIEGQFWNGNFGQVQNTLKYAWRRKLANSNTWGEWSDFTLLQLSSNNFKIENLDLGTDYATNLSYDFQFQFIDELGNLDSSKIIITSPQNVTVSTPIVEVYEDSVNINGALTIFDREIASGSSSYSDLTNKPALNTNNTSAQSVSSSESINGTIKLHKVSKTGGYGDLLNKPVLNTNNGGSLGVNGSESINGTISLHKVSKTGNFNDLLNRPTIPTNTTQLTNGSGYINTSASSKAQNGYFKLSNGLIVQWGTCSTGSAVTMPTSFSSTSSFAIVGTDAAQGASATINIVVNAANKFTAYAKYGSTYYTDTIRWIAIGY